MLNIKKRLKNSLRSIISILFGKQFSACDISKSDIISFDVFDTLIYRKVKTPMDVFDLIYIDDVGFKDKRIIAGREAKQCCEKEDCTLKEIYDLLPDCKEEKKEELMGREIEAELSVCYANDEALTFYNKCKALGKRVIIVSDMYLSGEVISQILKDNGYELDGVKVYVSSEYGLTKRSGNLFKHVIQEEGSTSILHIGDNAISDFAVPRREGLKAFLYRSAK